MPTPGPTARPRDPGAGAELRLQPGRGCGCPLHAGNCSSALLRGRSACWESLFHSPFCAGRRGPGAVHVGDRSSALPSARAGVVPAQCMLGTLVLIFSEGQAKLVAGEVSSSAPPGTLQFSLAAPSADLGGDWKRAGRVEPTVHPRRFGVGRHRFRPLGSPGAE